MCVHIDGGKARVQDIVHADAEMAKQIDQFADRALPHARDAVEVVLAVAQRAHRGDEANGRSAVAAKQVGRGFFDRPAESVHLHDMVRPIDFQAEGMFGADELAISTTDSEGAQGRLTGPTHLAFQAKDEAMVQAFYDAGLAAGGTNNGAPGERSYHPGYYAAFLLDPDGNNIEAVFHGAAKRSAASVEISFAAPQG